MPGHRAQVIYGHISLWATVVDERDVMGVPVSDPSAEHRRSARYVPHRPRSDGGTPTGAATVMPFGPGAAEGAAKAYMRRVDRVF